MAKSQTERGSQTSSSNLISIHSFPPPPTENINIPEVDSQYVEDSSATTFFLGGTIKCLQVLQLASLTQPTPSLTVSVVHSPFAKIPGSNACGSPRSSIGIVTVHIRIRWFVMCGSSFSTPQSFLGISFWTAS